MLQDRYAQEREDFELFCLETPTMRSLSLAFEYDYEAQQYTDRHVEDSFHIWFSAWGFGFNEGVAYRAKQEGKETTKMALDFTDSIPQLKPEATIADYVDLTNSLFTNKKDDRIGIDDKINPDLLKKRMRDWESED